jgi:hypothetical protein
LLAGTSSLTTFGSSDGSSSGEDDEDSASGARELTVGLGTVVGAAFGTVFLLLESEVALRMRVQRGASVILERVVMR